jgi:hypothetical protein
MIPSHARTLTLPEIQALAGRLHARGSAPIGSDSSASQADMLAGAAVIRALLGQCIAAAETAGQLGLQLSGPISVGEA